MRAHRTYPAGPAGQQAPISSIHLRRTPHGLAAPPLPRCKEAAWLSEATAAGSHTAARPALSHALAREASQEERTA